MTMTTPRPVKGFDPAAGSVGFRVKLKMMMTMTMKRMMTIQTPPRADSPRDAKLTRLQAAVAAAAAAALDPLRIGERQRRVLPGRR